MERGMRQRLYNLYKQYAPALANYYEAAVVNPSVLDEIMKRNPRLGLNREEAMGELEVELDEFISAEAMLRDCKVVVFDQAQAEVFLRTSLEYVDTLEYRLPFRFVMLQFTEPIDVKLDYHTTDKLIAILLGQVPMTKEGYDDAKRMLEMRNMFYKTKMKIPEKFEEGIQGNIAIGVFADCNIRKLLWNSGSDVHFFQSNEDAGIMEGWDRIRNLAIACIGYINCENIYLHQEGGAPDKVNRKREQQGKKILEPYYVCRIRGMQYDSNGEPTGQGTHHGFRYDVRGHFRRLDSGKTTWVRPHQRGLQNELYIPKTYVVEKGAKKVNA